jgi:hypothetical protein
LNRPPRGLKQALGTLLAPRQSVPLPSALQVQLGMVAAHFGRQRVEEPLRLNSGDLAGVSPFAASLGRPANIFAS